MGNEFIDSYFTNRHQFVINNKVNSEILDQKLGTFQGPKTGPMYFNISSNDLNKRYRFDFYKR